MKTFATGLMLAVSVFAIACGRPTARCSYQVGSAGSNYEVVHLDGFREFLVSSAGGILTVTRRPGETCTQIKYGTVLGGYED